MPKPGVIELRIKFVPATRQLTVETEPADAMNDRIVLYGMMRLAEETLGRTATVHFLRESGMISKGISIVPGGSVPGT